MYGIKVWKAEIIEEEVEPEDGCIRCGELLRPEKNQKGIWLNKDHDFWIHEVCWLITSRQVEKALLKHCIENPSPKYKWEKKIELIATL